MKERKAEDARRFRHLDSECTVLAGPLMAPSFLTSLSGAAKSKTLIPSILRRHEKNSKCAIAKSKSINDACTTVKKTPSPPNALYLIPNAHSTPLLAQRLRDATDLSKTRMTAQLDQVSKYVTAKKRPPFQTRTFDGHRKVTIGKHDTQTLSICKLYGFAQVHNRPTTDLLWDKKERKKTAGQKCTQSGGQRPRNDFAIGNS